MICKGQGNAEIAELKRMKVLLRSGENSSKKEITAKDVNTLQNYACKAFLPFQTYEALTAFEDTLTGEVRDDFVSYIL